MLCYAGWVGKPFGIKKDLQGAADMEEEHFRLRKRRAESLRGRGCVLRSMLLEQNEQGGDNRK